MTSLGLRLVADEEGQDLIEYALLTTVIGLAAIAVFDILRNSIASVYGTWNTGANSYWEPQNPSGS